VRRFLLICLSAAGLSVLLGSLPSLTEVERLSAPAALRVGLCFNPRLLPEAEPSLAAHGSVLAEEGVPYRRVDLFALLSTDPRQVLQGLPALILPDGACRIANSALGPWLARYLQAGGGLLIVHDAGTRSFKDGRLPRGILDGLTGLQPRNEAPGRLEPAEAALRFRDRDTAGRCSIPPGKLDQELFLTGYRYGRLEYPCFRCVATPRAGDPWPPPELLAEAVFTDGATGPAIIRRRCGSGLLMYAGLPLGRLKADGDDVPLRSLLRMFLFRELAFPHLLAVPGGMGGIIINWHLDDVRDRRCLAAMIDEKLLRPELPSSLHITAGEGVDRPGDGRGFDACGEGRLWVERLQRFGEIGSHGGWYHNLFAAGLESGSLSAEQAAALLARNDSCLESVTGRPVWEYSAPGGVHPQPLMSDLLERRGTLAYYTTSDGGGPPTLSFSEGRLLSARMVAVPVLPLGPLASLGEMARHQVDPAELAAWLNETTAYCADERTVRLIYSHPHDLFGHPLADGYRQVIAAWLDELERLQAAGRLTVAPMSRYAIHLRRALGVACEFKPGPGGLQVRLASSASLRDIAVAVPRRHCSRPQEPGLSVSEDDRYWYIVIKDDRHELLLQSNPL
jgi:hypothetical protein